jgi:hypothetical protein
MNGGLGFGTSIAGATQYCNDRAAFAGLPGAYVPFLATYTLPPTAAIASLGNTKGWRLVTGELAMNPPAADGTIDLNLVHRIDRDEFGNRVTQDTWVWTGSASQPQTCQSWTTSAGSALGVVGLLLGNEQGAIPAPGRW